MVVRNGLFELVDKMGFDVAANRRNNQAPRFSGKLSINSCGFPWTKAIVNSKCTNANYISFCGLFNRQFKLACGIIDCEGILITSHDQL